MHPITWDPTEYDVIVIGGGHAGCEAALAASRLGARALLLTLNLDRVAHMPCNCSIGGPGKSHLVREIDALGGYMAQNIDASLTHVRLLNTSKGPAVQATRAQADKRAYEEGMKHRLEHEPNLLLRQAEVTEIATDDRGVVGVVTATGMGFRAPAVVLATGTFLRATVFIGHRTFDYGRAGEPAALHLSASLERLGIHLGRLKTGTVPRIHRRSIDDARCEVQPPDQTGLRFSFLTTQVRTEGLLPCLLTWTNADTHDIVREALPLSATYGGLIEGIGPRYCPSIEAKIVRFPDKERHQVFLELEGWRTSEVYVWGLSNSLPENVQLTMLHSIPGLGKAEITRPGYAVEYDFSDPRQVDYSLQSRTVPGLFLAGQINGTSGYEEAAVQGLLAGTNAVRRQRDAEPLVLRRDEAYAGVLVDDLVSRGVDEPYRMMTSRAEYRLSLRQSNADLRLTPRAREIGLVDDARWSAFEARRARIEEELGRLEATTLRPGPELDAWADEVGTARPSQAQSAARLLARSDVTYADVVRVAAHGRLSADDREEVVARIKYAGYEALEREQAARSRELEDARIPDGLDYAGLRGLKTEAREKLGRIRPMTLGQAARVPGVTASDLSVLALHLAARSRAETRTPSPPGRAGTRVAGG